MKKSGFLVQLIIICIGIFSISQQVHSTDLSPVRVIQHDRIIEKYHEDIAREINKNWTIDPESDIDVFQMASLVFKIMPDGEIKDILFIKRSGNTDLDKSAYSAIKKTSPTNPFPKGIDKSFLQMGIRFCPNGVK